MRPDKYKRRQQAPRADDRLRLQIAREAARRLYPRIAPEDGEGPPTYTTWQDPDGTRNDRGVTGGPGAE